jgi:hypothetical protein
MDIGEMGCDTRYYRFGVVSPSTQNPSSKIALGLMGATLVAMNLGLDQFYRCGTICHQFRLKPLKLIPEDDGRD